MYLYVLQHARARDSGECAQMPAQQQQESRRRQLRRQHAEQVAWHFFVIGVVLLAELASAGLVDRQ
jgi:hypothetical protein